MEILVFELGGSRYAIPIADVVEVVRAVAVNPLPSAPPIVEGVINLRGRIVPVLDLRRRFGHASGPVHPDEHFVVARAGERVVAFRADPATRLARAAPGDVTRAEGVVSGVQHVTGMVRMPDGVALLGDLHGFLTQAEGMTLDGALAGADAPAAADAAR